MKSLISLVLFFCLSFASYASSIANNLTIGGDATVKNGKELKLGDTTNTYTTSFKSHAAPTASTTYVLPAADGTAGQVLKTDGSANLSWTAASVGTVTGTGTTNTMTKFTGSSVIGDSSISDNGTIVHLNAVDLQTDAGKYTYSGSPTVDGSTRTYSSAGAFIHESRVLGSWVETARFDNL